MAEPHFAGEDDLPRTLRRERDLREQQRREREAREQGPASVPHASQADNDFGSAPFPSHLQSRESTRGDHEAFALNGDQGVVRRLEIPFTHLVAFFIKAVFAAIPAILILTVLLWLGGQGLRVAFPDLARMQILIQLPK